MDSCETSPIPVADIRTRGVYPMALPLTREKNAASRHSPVRDATFTPFRHSLRQLLDLSADRSGTRDTVRATSRARNREKSREVERTRVSFRIRVSTRSETRGDGTANGRNRRRKKRLAFMRIQDISRTPRLLNTWGSFGAWAAERASHLRSSTRVRVRDNLTRRERDFLAVIIIHIVVTI